VHFAATLLWAQSLPVALSVQPNSRGRGSLHVQVAEALSTLGLRLDASEVERLFGQLDLQGQGTLGRSMVAASQVGVCVCVVVCVCV